MLAFLLMAMENAKDETKFTLLYNEYIGFSFQISISYFKNYMDAEDATYTALLKIALNIDKIGDVYSSETKGYIAIATKNTCLNILKKKSKIKEIYFNEIEAFSEDEHIFNELSNEDSLLIKRLKKHISSLSDVQYEALFLKYVNELSTREIAKTLNIKENTVLQRIHSGKQKLAKLMKEDMANE